MLSKKEQERINNTTKRAAKRGKRQWESAVRKMYEKYGEDAIYYANAEHLAENQVDKPMLLPCEVHEEGGKIHFGFVVMHNYEEVDENGKMYQGTTDTKPVLFW